MFLSITLKLLRNALYVARDLLFALPCPFRFLFVVQVTTRTQAVLEENTQKNAPSISALLCCVLRDVSNLVLETSLLN
jgi:hypothetical protein